MNIFKDGYLKPEFINPEYRSLVGWECEIIHDENNLITIYTIMNQTVHSWGCTWNILELNIPEFTPKDIPIGELCWFTNKCTWVLSTFSRMLTQGSYSKKFLADSTVCGLGHDFKYCVPYLIAKTKEDAERLKNWSKI